MLTVLSKLVPDIRDIHYSIYAEYCGAQCKYHCKMKDKEKALYWFKLESKYLMKRVEILTRKRG
jgi:hypothetical protein